MDEAITLSVLVALVQYRKVDDCTTWLQVERFAPVSGQFEACELLADQD
jgi:hypothetical protein